MNTPIKIKVTTPNRMIPVNGNLVRTPVEIEIKSEDHLRFIEMYLRKECAEYEIIDDTPEAQEEIELNPVIIDEVETPVIEEVEEVSDRILDNILKTK